MALKTRYTNVGGQVAAVKTGGQRYFVEPDALGNVRGLVNQSGVRSQTYTYWPYGEVRTSTGSVSQPLQFCGTWGYYTESSSKQYVRARYYMQSIGRWQTVDPLWPEEMAYGYAQNRPSLLVDESGKDVFTKELCREWCAHIFTKSKKTECDRLCRDMRGNTCNELKRFCTHLGAGHHDYDISEKVCRKLLDNMCNGGLPVPVPVPVPAPQPDPEPDGARPDRWRPGYGKEPIVPARAPSTVTCAIILYWIIREGTRFLPIP